MSGLQEETKGLLLGLPRVGVRAGQQPPISSLALGGFLAQGQLSGLTIAVPPSWSRQLDSSAWGLARPLPLPLSPRQGASCYDPLHPETPSDPPASAWAFVGAGYELVAQEVGGQDFGVPLSPFPLQRAVKRRGPS